MFRYLPFFLCLQFGLISGLSAQVDSVSDTYLEEYKKRVSKSHINGFYIPVDLEDAMITLDDIMDVDAKRNFGSRVEETAVTKSFFSFGTWLTANWGLLDGSRLSVALNGLGVKETDNMVWLLMRSYHRHLNNRPLNVDEQLKAFSRTETKDH